MSCFTNTTLQMAYASTGGWNRGEGQRGGRRENDRMFVVFFFLFCFVWVLFLVISVCFVMCNTFLERRLVLLGGKWL